MLIESPPPVALADLTFSFQFHAPTASAKQQVMSRVSVRNAQKTNKQTRARHQLEQANKPKYYAVHVDTEHQEEEMMLANGRDCCADTPTMYYLYMWTVHIQIQSIHRLVEIDWHLIFYLK
jgi:hypothetical protein